MNEKETQQTFTNSEENENGEVFVSQEYQDFKDTISSYESDKQKNKQKISVLQSQLARETRQNLDLKNELEEEASRRKKAENKLAELKNSSDKGSYQARKKTTEELFAEQYLATTQKIRNRN